MEAEQDAASAPIPRQPDAATFGVVAVVAFSTLALQVLLTRILAALVFYHFSFLAISLALLGTGAGGLYVSLRQPPPNRFALRVLLSGWAAVLAVTLTLVPVVIVRLNFDYSDGLSPHFVFAMTVACIVSALPSFAAGVVIAMAIRAHAQVVGRIYAVDLVAAGLGALLVVPAIWLIDPPHLVVALGLLAAVTAVAVAPDLRARRWAGLAGVVPAVGAHRSAPHVDPHRAGAGARPRGHDPLRGVDASVAGHRRHPLRAELVRSRVLRPRERAGHQLRPGRTVTRLASAAARAADDPERARAQGEGADHRRRRWT